MHNALNLNELEYKISLLIIKLVYTCSTDKLSIFSIHDYCPHLNVAVIDVQGTVYDLFRVAFRKVER